MSEPQPPAPLPVRPLAYSSLPGAARPGLMTALAVMSIVIGGFSLLSALSSAASTTVMMALPPPAPVPAPPPPATAPAVATTTTTIATSTSMTVTATSVTSVAWTAGPTKPTMFATPWVVLGLVDAFLRVALAVLLIVAGVFVLRDHRLGRRLHLLWAWLRIPLALVSGVVSWQMMQAMFRSMAAAPGTPFPPQSMTWVAVMSGGMQVVLAWIYPIAVLIVLRTRTARTYHATLTA